MNDTRSIAAGLVERRKNPDAERLHEIQQKFLSMLTVSHRALAAISKGEISEAGARSMANLAAGALAEIESIAEEGK